MRISNTVKQYVKESIQVSKSNVIITDLKQIKLIEFINSINQQEISNYLLSDTAVEILQKWITANKQSDLFMLLNSKECIKVLKQDDIAYSCQIIFPIFTRKGIEGLLILYRTSGNYISSSLRAVENFKKFINSFIDDTYN